MILNNFYGTDIRQLNFGNANNAANIINSWVREHTRDNIKSIIQPGTFNLSIRNSKNDFIHIKKRSLEDFVWKNTHLCCLILKCRALWKILFCFRHSWRRHPNTINFGLILQRTMVEILRQTCHASTVFPCSHTWLPKYSHDGKQFQVSVRLYRFPRCWCSGNPVFGMIFNSYITKSMRNFQRFTRTYILTDFLMNL